MRLNLRERLQHLQSIVHRLAQADDTARTQGHVGLANLLQGLQPIRIGAGGDDGLVELGRRIDVVVVGVKSGLFETLGLMLVEHAQSAANLHAKVGHSANHI